MRTISIVFNDESRLFDVHEGDRYTDRLAWDEMLGQIAQLTHPSINRAHYEMLTAEEHAAREARHLERVNQRERMNKHATTTGEKNA